MIIEREPVDFPKRDMRVVFMSGLSDPRECLLSRAQVDMMRSICVSDECKLFRNFPYVNSDREEQSGVIYQRKVPLVRASISNAHQFLNCRSRRYLDVAVTHWASVLKSADSIIVITLSCGLEIFNRLMAHIGGFERCRSTKIELIALGPVAWQTPQYRCTMIQGEQDYLSRSFFRVNQRVPKLGHMDYVRDARVIDRINEVICGSISKS